MKEICKRNLNSVEGGSISAWGVVGIGSAIVFLIGVIDGFVRPLKCN